METKTSQSSFHILGLDQQSINATTDEWPTFFPCLWLVDPYLYLAASSSFSMQNKEVSYALSSSSSSDFERLEHEDSHSNTGPDRQTHTHTHIFTHTHTHKYKDTASYLQPCSFFLLNNLCLWEMVVCACFWSVVQLKWTKFHDHSLIKLNLAKIGTARAFASLRVPVPPSNSAAASATADGNQPQAESGQPSGRAGTPQETPRSHHPAPVQQQSTAFGGLAGMVAGMSGPTMPLPQQEQQQQFLCQTQADGHDVNYDAAGRGTYVSADEHEPASTARLRTCSRMMVPCQWLHSPSNSSDLWCSLTLRAIEEIFPVRIIGCFWSFGSF